MGSWWGGVRRWWGGIRRWWGGGGEASERLSGKGGGGRELWRGCGRGEIWGCVEEGRYLGVWRRRDMEGRVEEGGGDMEEEGDTEDEKEHST